MYDLACDTLLINIISHTHLIITMFCMFYDVFRISRNEFWSTLSESTAGCHIVAVISDTHPHFLSSLISDNTVESDFSSAFYFE